MTRWFTSLTIALVAVATSAHAAEPSLRAVHMPWEDAARAALVDVESAWLMAHGVLVGDTATVWSTFGFIDTGRPFEVTHARGGPMIEATGRSYEHDHRSAWVLALEAPLAGTPLAVADAVTITVGMTVYGFEVRGDDLGEAQLVEVMVGAVADGHFTLATHPWTLTPGSPILDAAGELIGLLGWNLEVIPARAIAEAPLAERGLSVLPLIGYRAGYQSGGLLGDSGVLDLELGVTLGDRVSLVGIFGLGFRAPTGGLLQLPEGDGEGFGRVAFDDSIALRAGFEARYRQQLTGGFFPLYLDVAAGLLSTSHFRTASGPVFRSTEPGCDPGVSGCDLRLDATPELDAEHTLDASLGLDLRWGPASLGYRFNPGFGDAPAAHTLLFGVSFF